MFYSSYWNSKQQKATYHKSERRGKVLSLPKIEMKWNEMYFEQNYLYTTIGLLVCAVQLSLNIWIYRAMRDAVSIKNVQARQSYVLIKAT